MPAANGANFIKWSLSEVEALSNRLTIERVENVNEGVVNNHLVRLLCWYFSTY
jgi:hypothetical protein